MVRNIFCNNPQIFYFVGTNLYFIFYMHKFTYKYAKTGQLESNHNLFLKHKISIKNDSSKIYKYVHEMYNCNS